MAESRYVHEYPGAPEGGGEIISVAEGSPFDDAGFTPGCRDRKSTRLNSSHLEQSRMPSSA